MSDIGIDIDIEQAEFESKEVKFRPVTEFVKAGILYEDSLPKSRYHPQLVYEICLIMFKSSGVNRITSINSST